MTKHEFKLAGADGSGDVEILRSWLRENTTGGTVEIVPVPKTRRDEILEMGTSKPPIVRICFEVTVHSDDDAFWTKMRWGEDMVAYEDAMRKREAESDQFEDAMRKREAESDQFVEHYLGAQSHPWFAPSTLGPGSYSVGAAHSKMIPAYHPSAASAVTKTAQEVLRGMIHKAHRITNLYTDEELIESFGGLIGGLRDTDSAYLNALRYLQSGSSVDDDPER